jgi:hypothetical protein
VIVGRHGVTVEDAEPPLIKLIKLDDQDRLIRSISFREASCGRPAGDAGRIDQRDINRDQSHRINSIILSLNRHNSPCSSRARVPSSGFGAIRQVTIISHQTDARRSGWAVSEGLL